MDNLGDSQRSLSDQARELIRARITGGDYPPGTRLKQRDLSAELGISAIPVREALTSLAAEGFVTITPRRGAVVREMVPDDLTEIFEIREALEVQEVILALRHGTPEDIARLLAAVKAEEVALRAGNREEVGEANSSFHEVLLEMTHNQLLADMLAPLRGRLNWLFRQNDDARAISAEHREIADAIAAGDKDRARQLAISHVKTSRKLAMRLLFGSEDAE